MKTPAHWNRLRKMERLASLMGYTLVRTDSIRTATVSSRLADRYIARVNHEERDRVVRDAMCYDLAHFLLKEATFTYKPYDPGRDLHFVHPDESEYRYTVTVLQPHKPRA